MRIAPRTLRTQSAIMSARPRQNTSTGQPPRWPSTPSWTGTVVWKASGMRVTTRASTKPMRAMNRPIPTEIATLSCCGTAWKTALRKPVSTSSRITMPSSTTRPIAAPQVDWRAIVLATNALRPSPVARASGKLANPPMAMVSTPATSAVPAAMAGMPLPGSAPPPEEGARRVGHEAEDERVEHDDVGHRQEGHDAAADLAPDGRAALADPEVAVEAGALRSLSLCLRLVAHRTAVWHEDVLRPRCTTARACSVSAWTWVTSSRRSTRSVGRTYIVAQVEPLDVDGVRTTEVGTALWLLGFLGPAAVLGRARGQRSHLVAVDLPRRLRARPLRPGVLPSPAQGAGRPAGGR